ncbi:MAG: hypothetical protein KGL39_00890 [Patescibacteria group bacterium]|nr:hypothetical protein [Patescibacteria group bacterium]
MIQVECAAPAAYQLLQDGAMAFAAMEHAGIHIDVDYLERTTKRIIKKIARLQEQLKQDEIWKVWEKRFGAKANLGSRPQLAEVFFGELGHKSRYFTTKTRRPSADDKNFEGIDVPFIKSYFLAEKYKKLAGTYLKGLRNEVVDGFIHPNFNLHTVTTFRSCIAKGTIIQAAESITRQPKEVPIEDVKVGDYVYCYDRELNLAVKKVLWSGKTGRRNVIRIHWSTKGKQGFLDLTPGHPVLLANGHYIEAQYSGAHYTPNNHVITKVEWIDVEADVYDLEVEECSNFIANEICVHNSGSDPNWQNIPIRDPEIGRYIRNCVIPRPGRVLAEIDFAALEFRGAACRWKDPGMIEYASDPTKDIHRDEAAGLFSCDASLINKQTRYVAKNQFVFPILYGSYYVSCARNIWEQMEKLKLTVDGQSAREWLKSKDIKKLGKCSSNFPSQQGTYEYHVKTREEAFNNRFPGFAKGKEQCIADYQRRGWFRTMTGFILKGLFSKNFLLNGDIQGSMFHCLLWSLIRIQKLLKKRGLKSLIIAQIHDCLLLDVLKEELQEVLYLAKRVMTQDLLKAWNWLVVPMDVEVDVTDTTWADKAVWIEEGGIWQPKAKVVMA